MTSNKLYALYYVHPIIPDTICDGTSHFVSASNSIDKLTKSIPSVNTWYIANDPNDPTLKRHTKLNNNGEEYQIREVPYIV